MISLNEFDVDGAKNGRLNSYSADVSTTGFTLHIVTWADTGIWSASAAWQAFLPPQ